MYRLALGVLALVVMANCRWEQKSPEIIFEIEEKDIIPEGIAYDPVEQCFYLGSIHKHKILKITRTGEVSDFIPYGQDSLREVLGMKTDHNRRLWVCNNLFEKDTLNRIANVHVFDIPTGTLVNHYRLQDGRSHLFNDLYITTSGNVYITDSEGGNIYVIRKGEDRLEEFTQPGKMRYPNGITATADEKKLIVSTGSAAGIVSVDIETKEITPIRHPKFILLGFDGLYRYKNSLIGIQNVLFPEAVIEMRLSADSDSIEHMEVLVADHPAFDTPTTGVIAEEHFYFIANSQLSQIIGNFGKIRNPDKLENTRIMRINRVEYSGKKNAE